MSSEGETKTISKTQASLLEKGDKSYYYWHNKVGNKAPFVPPPLISKQIIDTQPNTNDDYICTTNYCWMDDNDYVKIIIELHKLINAQKDESFKAENVDCTFGEFSFDLRIKNFQGKNYRLEIKDLAQEILPNESHVKQYRSKISVSLKKKNKDESWDSLKK